MEIPQITLDARDIHVPPVLKALAAKHRATAPEKADQLDKTAEAFTAWRRANPSVK